MARYLDVHPANPQPRTIGQVVDLLKSDGLIAYPTDSCFAQLGQFVHLDNAVFRAVKAATPGQYTFILPATKEVPRRMLHPKKRTVGVRIPEHTTALALVDALGEPLVSSTLLLP